MAITCNNQTTKTNQGRHQCISESTISFTDKQNDYKEKCAYFLIQY